MMKNELCRLLKLIESIPCVLPEEEDNGIFYDLNRVNKIDEEINRSVTDYRRIKGKNYYRLYAQDTLENISKEYSRILLVSSHADNVQNSSSYNDNSNPGFINGCFDNAATNAICVYLMKYSKLPRNVLFAFTADEEYDSEGAEHVFSIIKKYFGKGNADVIVLDVTYGYQNGVDFTIENDYIYDNAFGRKFIEKVCRIANETTYSWNFLWKPKKKDSYIDSDKIWGMMGSNRKSYSKVVGGDETSEYKKAHFNTFSLCLPCSAEDQKQMHSEDGFEISIDTVCNYTDYLRRIIES